MAKGLKESKVAMFDINYETWPNSGDSYMDSELDSYIIGVTEELPKVYHGEVYIDTIETSAPVYLEDIGITENTWNKTYKDKTFSDKITSTENETGELNLYAKWSQSIYRGTRQQYKPGSDWGSGARTMPDNTLIFSWGN